MAGYDLYSKSNNALKAESEGKFPASVLAKRIRKYFKGVTAADIRKAMCAGEWHHTSKYYNQTQYYDLNDLAELYTRQELREAIRDRKERERLYKELVKVMPDAKYFKDADADVLKSMMERATGEI